MLIRTYFMLLQMNMNVQIVRCMQFIHSFAYESILNVNGCETAVVMRSGGRGERGNQTI